MNELKFIPLSDITMLSNYRDVEPVSEKDPDIAELSESILQHGVMQPILVRTNGKPSKYELIFGHRRLVAARKAGLTSIPATVKDVSDEQVLELQVTENLQRKDVHPIDEAIAFKALMEKKKYSAQEIALRFGKQEEYVVKRMKLNDLIPEGQKLFKEKKMLLIHAFQICRLQPTDQKSILKESGSRLLNMSASDLHDEIEQEIFNSLDGAPWKKDDADLLPAAGACSVCPKRSGNQNLLFNDLKGKICADAVCYAKKFEAFIAKQALEILEERPEVLLIIDDNRYNDEGKAPADVVAKAKELGIKILKDGDFSTYRSDYGSVKFTVKKKGFYLNGWRRGKTEDIWLPGKAPTAKAAKEKQQSGKLTAEDVSEMIKGINEREKRSREIDINKIHAEIEEQVKKNRSKILAVKPQPIDRGIMIYILLTEIGYNPDWRNETAGYIFDKIKDLAKWSDQKLSELIRNIVFKRMMHAGSDQEVRHKHTAIRLIAEYSGIDIKSIEKAQGEIAAQRNERIKKRISDLREQLKPKATKK